MSDRAPQAGNPQVSSEESTAMSENHPVGAEPVAARLPRTPAHSGPTAAEHLDHQDEWAADEFEELPARPRRRLATPLNAALLGLLLLACGFVGGVLVEKGQTSGSPSGGGQGFARRLAGGAGRATGAAGPAAGAANATIGTVANVNGHTLYVTDVQGNTVAIKAASGAKVSRTNTSSVSNIRPGDTIVAQGARDSAGALTATSIRATAPNAAAGGGGLAALFGGGAGRFGGGAGRFGGAPSAGAGAGAGGASKGDAGPQLFGSG